MAPPIKLIHTLAELRNWRQEVGGARVGFVPTMGALHEGHAALLKGIRPRCEHSVLSIFVNPTQFGPHEDFGKYPRALESDLDLARREGVDLVFAPAQEEIYPGGFSTFLEETRLSLPLCGSHRPGHFRGVLTIVIKLLNLVKPTLALFGMKDAQQYFVLKKMAQDLNLDVEIEAAPTVREGNGLAMSSRNEYLSPGARKQAAYIYATLLGVRDQIKNGAKVTVAVDEGREQLIGLGFEVQYLSCLKIPDLCEFPVLGDPMLIATAVLLEGTRLIDNVILV